MITLIEILAQLDTRKVQVETSPVFFLVGRKLIYFPWILMIQSL